MRDAGVLQSYLRRCSTLIRHRWCHCPCVSCTLLCDACPVFSAGPDSAAPQAGAAPFPTAARGPLPLPLLPTLCPCIAQGAHLFAAPQSATDPSAVIPDGCNQRTAMVHGVGHNLACRLTNLGYLTNGIGWQDGEQMERAWAPHSPIGRLIRGCSGMVWSDILSAAMQQFNVDKADSAHHSLTSELERALKRITEKDTEAAGAWTVAAGIPALCVLPSTLHSSALAASTAATWLDSLRRLVVGGAPPPASTEDSALLACRSADSAVILASFAARLHASARLLPVPPDQQLATLRRVCGKPMLADVPSEVEDATVLENARTAQEAAKLVLSAFPNGALRYQRGDANTLERDCEFRVEVDRLSAHVSAQGQQLRALQRLAGTAKERHAMRAENAGARRKASIAITLLKLRQLRPRCGATLAGVLLPSGDKITPAELEILETTVAAAFGGCSLGAGAVAAQLEVVRTFARHSRAREHVDILCTEMGRVLRSRLRVVALLTGRLREYLTDARAVAAALLAPRCAAAGAAATAVASTAVAAPDLSATDATLLHLVSDDVAPAAPPALRVAHTSPFAQGAVAEALPRASTMPSPTLPRYACPVGTVLEVYGYRAALRFLLGLGGCARSGLVFARGLLAQTREAARKMHAKLLRVSTAQGGAAGTKEVAARAVIQLVSVCHAVDADFDPTLPPTRDRLSGASVSVVDVSPFPELLAVVAEALRGDVRAPASVAMTHGPGGNSSGGGSHDVRGGDVGSRAAADGNGDLRDTGDDDSDGGSHGNDDNYVDDDHVDDDGDGSGDELDNYESDDAALDAALLAGE